MKDCRGIEIREGNIVVHVTRAGSWMAMRTGIVTAVVSSPRSYVIVEYEDDSTGRPYVSQNIMVVEGVPYVDSTEA